MTVVFTHLFDLRHFKNLEIPWIDHNALRQHGVATGEKIYEDVTSTHCFVGGIQPQFFDIV